MTETPHTPEPAEVEEPAENESDLEAPLEGEDTQESQAVPVEGEEEPRTFDDEVTAADEDEPDLDAVE